MLTSKFRPLIIAIVVLAVLGGGSYWYWATYMRGYVSTDDARLAATMIDVSPEIPGNIVKMPVDEGDHVKQGTLLFRLDDRDIKAQIAAAEARIPGLQAQVRIAEAKLTKAKKGARPEEIRMAKTTVEKLKTAVEQASRDYDRAQKLFAAGTLTRERLDNAETHTELSQRNLDEATERLRLLRHGTRSEDLDAAEAGLEAAKAQVTAAQTALKRAKLNLEHTKVVAPFDGVIVKRWKDPGENAAPGVPVLSLLDPQSLHVEANIQETDLDDVHVGDHVSMDVDAFPGVKLHGHVATIIRSTRSQLSLMPSEGVSGAFIKVTQRVPIRIALDALPDHHIKDYGPGLSVEIKIKSGSGGPEVAAASQSSAQASR